MRDIRPGIHIQIRYLVNQLLKHSLSLPKPVAHDSNHSWPSGGVHHSTKNLRGVVGLEREGKEGEESQ